MDTFVVEVKTAWWLTAYFYCLATVAAITGCEPNWQRVNYWIARSMVVRIAGSKGRWRRLRLREGWDG